MQFQDCLFSNDKGGELGLLNLLSDAVATLNDDDSNEEILHEELWSFEQLLLYQFEAEINTNEVINWETKTQHENVSVQQENDTKEIGTKKQTDDEKDSVVHESTLSSLDKGDQKNLAAEFMNEEKSVGSVSPRDTKRRKTSASNPSAPSEGNTSWFPISSEEDHETIVLEMSISDTLYHKSNNNTLNNQRRIQHKGSGAFSRGKYKCQRCGELKTNHICEYYEDKIMRSIATQIVREPILNFDSKFVTVRKTS